MTSADSPAGFTTFDVLPPAPVRAAGASAAALGGRLREAAGSVAGLLSARVHLSTDGTTVAVRADWTDEADYRAAVRTAGFPEAGFGGVPGAAVDGPAAGRAPGVVVVATRHVGGHASAHALADLLRRSGGWKGHHPGFIGARPYISPDGLTYVNYPQWVDEAAFRSYMADPRNAAGQEAIAALEVAAPSFVMCAVVADITSPAAS